MNGEPGTFIQGSTRKGSLPAALGVIPPITSVAPALPRRNRRRSRRPFPAAASCSSESKVGFIGPLLVVLDQCHRHHTPATDCLGSVGLPHLQLADGGLNRPLGQT